MDDYTNDDKLFLLSLARKTIEKGAKFISPDESEKKNLDKKFMEKRGGFVSLHKKGNLRGCIGYILPVYTLYQTVTENAFNAAYKDPRFSPVTKDEVKDLVIEISILTIPVKLNYKDSNDLLEKLNPLIDGVIIKKGFSQATFLPQVWEELSDKEEFLCHLCLKAGLSSGEWKKGTLDFEIYNAIVFSE